MINVSYHAQERIKSRLDCIGWSIEDVKSRLNRVKLPAYKVYVEVARFNHVINPGVDSTVGNVLVAVVDGGCLLKTVLFTMDNTRGQYSKRIKI